MHHLWGTCSSIGCLLDWSCDSGRSTELAPTTEAAQSCSSLSYVSLIDSHRIATQDIWCSCDSSLALATWLATTWVFAYTLARYDLNAWILFAWTFKIWLKTALIELLTCYTRISHRTWTFSIVCASSRWVSRAFVSTMSTYLVSGRFVALAARWGNSVLLCGQNLLLVRNTLLIWNISRAQILIEKIGSITTTCTSLLHYGWNHSRLIRRLNTIVCLPILKLLWRVDYWSTSCDCPRRLHSEWVWILDGQWLVLVRCYLTSSQLMCKKTFGSSRKLFHLHLFTGLFSQWRLTVRRWW